MLNALVDFKVPQNEPLYGYAPGSAERAALKKELDRLANLNLEIPLIIGGKEVRTGNFGYCIEPHNHQHVLAKFHKAGKKEVEMAIEASQKAKADWENMPFSMKATIFTKAAELLTTKYRHTLNAATMLNQSKNVYQAEIDSAAELADFWRFNPYYMQEMFKQQPTYSPRGTLNFLEYRALEGFVFALTPFNFTSIAGNLPTSPALMGNVVLWKPAQTAVFSNYFIMKILEEAGLPAGVINFLPGKGSEIADTILSSKLFAGLHFTGSTDVFCHLWERIGANIRNYKTYPRIVGETGGKDFIVAHESADQDALCTAIVRGAFEYQGQKCSALSRIYIPDTMWPSLKEQVIETMKDIKLGPPQDFSCFMNAVIDKASFDKSVSYIEYARKADDAEIVVGGNCDDSTGYFVAPTIILTTNPHFKSIEEEIFAPILTVYVYPAKEFDQVLELCDNTSPYGLTGAVFAQDRYAIVKAMDVLRHAAGNFYVNDKPTGAVVGQQPFGGSRASGTNDKAGSLTNLLRWVSPRTVKETYNPPTDYHYPFMKEK
ncbi:MAG TPA: L-glutamate gamma-semialdehyde dehydrogenase [Candidatus Cloacimonadota bacterium]|nr:L-glutamate gamma-semialdehyde dehydrogenase [Candidatus Cloacimonadota bacterium]